MSDLSVACRDFGSPFPPHPKAMSAEEIKVTKINRAFLLFFIAITWFCLTLKHEIYFCQKTNF